VNFDVGKAVRMSDIIDAADGRGLIIDTTLSSVVGALPGLEDFATAIVKINQSCDGLIINPGQAEHHASLLGGKHRAAPIIRLDWTNAYRDETFCLPATEVKRLMISNAEDAFSLGASAVVASFLMGYGDDFEATNIQDLSFLARECYPLSLPLWIDIRTVGEKVSEINFEESIKLGASFMQELGADGLIIPQCLLATCRYVCEWMQIPVLVRLKQTPTAEQLSEIMHSGAAGAVLPESLFALSDYPQQVNELYFEIHQGRRA